MSVSVATLPSIWKNRPRGVPQAGIFIQHRDTQGNLLETWEQPISNEAKNSADLLNISMDKPLLAGTLEVYLQNGSKNEVFYWGLHTLKEIVIDENHFTKITLPKPNKPIINELGCGDGTHDDGWGGCEIDEEVIVTAPPYNPNPWENSGPRSGDPGNSGGGDSGGGSSGGDSGGPAEGGEPDQDRPETKNKGFHFDMLRGDGSIIGDYITPVVTSYESGTLFRPNSHSQWKFQSFSFSNIGVNGRLLFEVWTASSLNPISNIDSDGSYASMDHTWQLVRNAALGEIIIPGAITYTTHQNSYGYNAN